MLAPIRPRPIIPSCIALTLHRGTMFRSVARRGDRRRLASCPVRRNPQIHDSACAISATVCIARRLFAPPGDQRIPENRAADRKSDEARHGRRDPEPFAHFTARPRRGRERCSRRHRARPRGPPPRRARNPRVDRALRSSRDPARRRRSWSSWMASTISRGRSSRS